MQLRCMILINNLTSSNVYYLSGNLQVKNEPTEQHCTNCFVFIFAESIGRVTQIILPGNHDYRHKQLVYLEENIMNFPDFRSL